MKATSLFFLKSPKRNRLLIVIVRANVEVAGRRQPLIDLCKTRWAERHCLPAFLSVLQLHGHCPRSHCFGTTSR